MNHTMPCPACRKQVAGVFKKKAFVFRCVGNEDRHSLTVFYIPPKDEQRAEAPEVPTVVLNDVQKMLARVTALAERGAQ